MTLSSLLKPLAVAALMAAMGAQAQTTLRIGYAVSTNSHYGVGSTVFCEDIEKGTQGRYKCQHFPSGSLGGEREMIEAVQLGTLDLVNTSTGPLGNFVPEVKIVDIPFLFRDYDHARKVMDGPIGQDLLKNMQAKGLIGLAWAENGFRHMTNSKRAIRTAEDAKGLKMRTMENKVHMDGYKTFGILPTPMPFPELFTALQQGTVDGQENPIPVILSPAVWNKLSAADKNVFLEAGKKGAAAQRKRVNDDENTGIAQLEKDGMQVIRQVNGESLRKAVTPAYQEYAKEFTAAKIAAIQAVR